MVAEVLLSDYLSSPTPYNRKQNVSSASLNKTVLPSSYKPLTVGVSISIHCGRIDLTTFYNFHFYQSNLLTDMFSQT